jgi:hypothetical protein
VSIDMATRAGPVVLARGPAARQHTALLAQHSGAASW